MPSATPFTIRLELFGPTAATAITGAKHQERRDWRRYGHAPPPTGPRGGRFDVFAVSWESGFRLIARQTRNLTTAGQLAPILATAIAWSVLGFRDAWGGQIARVLAHDERAMARMANAAQEARAAVEEIKGGPLGDTPDERLMVEHLAAENAWGPCRDVLRTEAMRGRGLWGHDGHKLQVGRFFVWYADGTETFCEDPKDAFPIRDLRDPRFGGPVSVLDSMSIARRLLDRAGQPMATVEFPR